MRAEQLQELIKSYGNQKPNQASLAIMKEILEMLDCIKIIDTWNYLWISSLDESKTEHFHLIKFHIDNAILVNECFIFTGSFDEGNQDLTDLYLWIKNAIQKSIEMLKAGTYKDYILSNLPYENKQGVIQLSEYWKYVPEDKYNTHNFFNKEETYKFLEWMDNTKDICIGYEQMTSGMFFDACLLIYRHMGYDVEGLTGKEAYLKYADGRDMGLTELADNSPEDFAEWYHIHRFGDHTEEIKGPRISFKVVKEDNGQYAFLFPHLTQLFRYREGISLILALIDAGYKLNSHYYRNIYDLYLGKCNVGIIPKIPDGDFSLLFENGIRNVPKRFLPLNPDENLLKEITWMPVRICELKK